MQCAVLLDLFVFTTLSSYEVRQQLVMLPVNVCVEMSVMEWTGGSMLFQGCRYFALMSAG